jgi:hypothetical protein
MKDRHRFLLALVFILLGPAFVFSADNKPVKKDGMNYMYYWEKGNRGEKISKEEFNILISELERKLADFKTASSQISIAGTNHSYQTGKMWEIELTHMNENIDAAMKYINSVKNRPDSMTLSLVLYVILIDIKTTAYDLDRINQFEKTLNKTHIALSLWCTAFQKAHLIPLAIAKDER